MTGFEFNAELYVKLGIFKELGYFFLELLKIDFSESLIGVTPTMFTKSCIILLLCKVPKQKGHHSFSLHISVFCLVKIWQKQLSRKQCCIQKCGWCTFFDTLAVSTVQKSVVFLQCAQVVSSHLFSSFSFYFQRQLRWFCDGAGSGGVNLRAMFLCVVFKAYGKGSHSSSYHGNASRNGFNWRAVKRLVFWIGGMNHLTCIPSSDTKFTSFCVD